MADTKISALSDGTAPAGSDQFPIARAGANNSLTWTEMLTAVKAVTLDLFAVPAAAVAMNAKKITGIAAATASTDAASLANRLDQFAAPTASVAMNTQKLTGLAAGSGAGDSLRYEQLFTAGAVPIADIADPTTGKVIGSSGGAAAAVLPPGYEVGYDQVTSNVTISSATEATGTTVISCAAHTFDGAAVMFEFFCPNATTTNDFLLFALFESSTEIGKIAAIDAAPAGTVTIQTVCARLRFTPTAGAHTYTVTASRGSANGTASAGAGGTGAYVPMYARFTKV